MRPELLVITLVASAVNGALGYGFSSITVPLALLFLTNRVLNPALVLLEVGLNGSVVWMNRGGLSGVRGVVVPIVAGLAPGVVLGTIVVSHARPDPLRLVTYLLLLPLILFQAAGHRRPLRGRHFGYPFGAGLGVLYSVTTISGPPLALLLNNQGVARRDFRAALGQIRLAESSFTAMMYFWAGLYTAESLRLLPMLIPGMIVGVPLGAWLIRRVEQETFRRLCMSFDAWIVGFGVSAVLHRTRGGHLWASYGFMASVVALDAVLLYRFFRKRRALVD